MRAFVIHEEDGVLTTTVEGHEVEPVPVEDESLIDVEWSGINFKDGMVATAPSRVRRSSRLIGGVDAAGTLRRSANGAIPAGTPVVVHGGDLGVARNGGFAEMLSAPNQYVTPLPQSLSTKTAMVIGTAGFTAAQSLLALEDYGVRPDAGEILVTGATGGVGSWAVALLAQRGYRVVASTGSAEVKDWLIGLGAERVIGRDEIADRPDRVLATERWAGAVDCVGGDTLHQIFRSLRYGAPVAASGLVASADLTTNVYPFITRAVSLLGIDAVFAPVALRQRVWSLLGDVVTRLDVERFIDEVISLEEIPAALERIRRGATRGRILVQI